MKAWRIEKRKRLAVAATGEGARLVGGRWNSAGLPLVYASEHLSLAVLEIIVHAPSPDQRTMARARAAVDVPDALVEVLPAKLVPPHFGPATAYGLTQAIGDEWLRTHRSVALLVPSAIVPVENNLLLNPLHPKFSQVAWGKFEAIDLDPRLWAIPP